MSLAFFLYWRRCPVRTAARAPRSRARGRDVSSTALQDTQPGSQGPAFLICAYEELKAGPGAQPAAASPPSEGGAAAPLTCVPGEASGPPPTETPGRPRGRHLRTGRPPPRPVGKADAFPPPPGHPLPPSQEPPPPPPEPPGTRHTPPHAGRQGYTPLPQRAPPAARPGASCGLGSRNRPKLRAMTWPGAPAGRPACPSGQARPGPCPRPAAAPRRLALRLAAHPPPAAGQAGPAPAQPPPRPRASLTPRSRRGSAVAG